MYIYTSCLYRAKATTTVPLGCHVYLLHISDIHMKTVLRTSWTSDAHVKYVPWCSCCHRVSGQVATCTRPAPMGTCVQMYIWTCQMWPLQTVWYGVILAIWCGMLTPASDSRLCKWLFFSSCTARNSARTVRSAFHLTADTGTCIQKISPVGDKYAHSLVLCWETMLSHIPSQPEHATPLVTMVTMYGDTIQSDAYDYVLHRVMVNNGTLLSIHQ